MAITQHCLSEIFGYKEDSKRYPEEDNLAVGCGSLWQKVAVNCADVGSNSHRNWPLIRPKEGTPSKRGGGKEGVRQERRLWQTDGENYHTCCQRVELLMSNWICC